jgi:hypothetical protein
MAALLTRTGLTGRSTAALCVVIGLLGTAALATSPASAAPQDLTSTEYGYSVAISGSTLAVGAPGLNQGEGAVYVFTLSRDGLHTQAKIEDPARRDQDAFGWSVALTSTKSGTYLAVGETGFNIYSDIVYVYHRTGSTWHRQATLHDPESYYGDNFGSAVALTTNTLAVGASTADNQEGVLYIYSRSGSAWTRRATFKDPRHNFGDDFGYSVAVSGSSAIATSDGLVYVYSAGIGRHWARSAIIPNPADPTDNFGFSAALSGHTAVIGAPGDSTAFSQGAAYVYVHSGTKWKVQGRLVNANGTADDAFGNSVSISGNRVLVGAPLKGRHSCGAAYEYIRTKSRWSLKLVTHDVKLCVPGSQFGSSVSVSNKTAFIGAPDENKAYVRGIP